MRNLSFSFILELKSFGIQILGLDSFINEIPTKSSFSSFTWMNKLLFIS